jgi:DinB superfamily
MRYESIIVALLEEAYRKKTWHGPNLRQAIKGVTAGEAAWRPVPGGHNIWEEVLHAAYWKYMVRRRLEGGKRASFVLRGRNFFARPEKGKTWRADQSILETEHRRLVRTVRQILKSPRARKHLPMLYGVAFHDVYHAGQIRLLRRLQQR